MALKATGTLVTSTVGVTAYNATVPAGVVATDTCFLAFIGSTTSPTTVTITKSGAQIATYRTDTGVWNTYAASPANATTVATGLTTTTNMWQVYAKLTGLVAGDTIAITCTSVVAQVHHLYFDNDLTPVGTWAVKAATTITVPSVTVAVGQKTYFWANSRGSAMTLSSVANSNSLTVGTDYSHLDGATAPICIAHLFDVVPTTTSTGTVTATYNTSNTNGGGFGFAEVTPASAKRPPATITRVAVARASTY